VGRCRDSKALKNHAPGVCRGVLWNVSFLD
jgi:hypothetical protein